MSREVTEEDFRMPEFRGARVEDYEFRDDGKLVRKDRWEMGIQKIRSLLGDNRRNFEIDDVVRAVEALVATVPPRDDVDEDGYPIEKERQS